MEKKREEKSTLPTHLLFLHRFIMTSRSSMIHDVVNRGAIRQKTSDYKKPNTPVIYNVYLTPYDK